MVLVQKWPSFQLFFLGNIDQENVFYDILKQKMSLQAIKTRRSKSQKIVIFLKGITHGLGPKMAIFPIFFFFSNIDQENIFYDVLARKNAFLGYKNKKFKQFKNGHFSNFFFLSNIDQENIFYDVLAPKNAFLGYKNKKFKQFKN